MTVETVDFPDGPFYIKSADSPSGSCLVVEAEHRGFLAAFSGIKDGTKMCVYNQKSSTDHDPDQLWRYEEGWIVSYNNPNLVLHAEGK
jgi:hypothetical protein